MSSTTKPAATNFEASLAELEKIVERMEHKEQTLDAAIKDFERGMKLSDQCQKSLDAAQLKVDKLIQKHSKEELKPFDDVTEI